MICEYTIRITGNQDILVLSPQIIGRLIEKIRCSDTKELIIPADELLPQGYAEYLERVMQTNNIEKNIGRQDAYDLTAKQIGMLKVKRQQCFDKAKAETTENATQFNLETNESFFLLTKQSDSRFVCDYENGEKIVVSLDHFSIWWQTFINKRTVEILIKSLKVSQEVEDLLVYPIVYNARHSIELSLKIVIKMLWELERKKKISHLVEFIVERKKKLHTHNIEELYKMACENKNIDRRIPAYFENIEDMIQFYYFDEEGDAFKYELNKDDQPHMIKNKISHALVLKTDYLLRILETIHQYFPDIQYITSYARADSITRKSPSELRILREAGLNHIYSGIETGSDQILKLINKGFNADTAVKSGCMAKEADMILSEFILLGIGGKELSEENATRTAEALNVIRPDFIRVHATGIKPESKMGEFVRGGSFTLQSEEEIMIEQKRFLQQLKEMDSYYVNEHIINLLLEVRGNLRTDKEKMLSDINRFLNLPANEKLLFVIGRRFNIFFMLDDLNNQELHKKAEGALQKILNKNPEVDFTVLCNYIRQSQI